MTRGLPVKPALARSAVRYLLVLCVGLSVVTLFLLATASANTALFAEHYQLLLGGSGAEDTSQAKIAGPGFDEAGIVDAVERTVERYRELREPGERFLDTYRRVGLDAFKEAIYG